MTDKSLIPHSRRAWTLLLNAEGEPRGVLTDNGGGSIFGHCDGERVRVTEADAVIVCAKCGEDWPCVGFLRKLPGHRRAGREEPT